jgi:hypothetical protein
VIDPATTEGETRFASHRIDQRQWRQQQAVVSGEIRRLTGANTIRRPPSADAGLLTDAGLLPAVIADLELARRSSVAMSVEAQH